MVNKMAFMVFKKLGFPIFLLNYSENSNFLQHSWKFIPLNEKILAKTSSTIQFIHLSCIEEPKNLSWCNIFGLSKNWTTKFCCFFFSPFGQKVRILWLEIDALRNISEKNENLIEKCHPESTKKQLCSKLFQSRSALLIFQRRIRTEMALTRSDNFWIRSDERWNPMRPQPGLACKNVSHFLKNFLWNHCFKD